MRASRPRHGGSRRPQSADQLEAAVRRAVNTPLKWAIGWLGGTLLLWFLLLRTPSSLRPTATVIVALAGMAALALGYKLALRSRVVSRALHGLEVESPPTSRAVVALAGLGIAHYLVAAYLNFSVVQDYSFFDLQAASAGYAARQEALLATNTSPLLAFVMFTGITQFLLIPILVLARPLVPKVIWIGAVASVVAYVASWIAIGTIKGVADSALILLISLLIRQGQRRFSIARAKSGGSERSRTRSGWVKIAAVALGALLLTAAILGNRLASYSSDVTVTLNNPTIRSVLGDDATLGLSGLIDYVSGGYVGLGANLTMPFVPTFGLGASPGLAGLVEMSTGYTVDPDLTFPMRTEQATGVPALEKWQTVYPWLASDLTFLGAVVAIGLVGFLFARAWVRAIFTGRLIWVGWTVVGFLFIMYIPLNNQLIASTQNAIALLLLSVATVVHLSRRRPVIEAPSRSETA